MFDVAAIRRQFPALQRSVAGKTPIYLDGPGGTQVPERVLDAMRHYLIEANANHGGAFSTSHESDRILEQAHQAAADLLHAPSPDEIIFGQNMTSLTFHISRSLGRTWQPRDEIVVTRLDHDANVRPWVLAARDAGATVHMIDIHTQNCTLDLEAFRQRLSPRTRLVAVTCASNAVGTVNDVQQLTAWAHEVGALVYLDAVHYAPHALVDVQAWGCDFLACSAYKFFGPHVGILWGRRKYLEMLDPYKVRPAPDSIPGRWMTGTQNHEGLAGVAAAIEYLADLGTGATRRERLVSALQAIRTHEEQLSRAFLHGIAERPQFHVWGLTRPDCVAHRTPTFGLTCSRHTPRELAAHLASHEIYAWDGNFYAAELVDRLGADAPHGLLRLGFVHYNTVDEIERLFDVLDELN